MRIFLFLFLTSMVLQMGCSGLEKSERERMRNQNAVGEFIHRKHDEFFFVTSKPEKTKRENYSWEKGDIGNHPRVIKEAFRCKGSLSNPIATHHEQGRSIQTTDCGGSENHSLPLKDGKEFIYPTLLEILNYIQEQTQKQIVVTCGHRCPKHNTYADTSNFNSTSKHMIGAEVDFYVKGMEWSPEAVISLIEKYYQNQPQLKENPQFSQFSRYENYTDVSTLPWYNKEVFVKIYKKDEGRDIDNNHRFPYISIQLKWDRQIQSPVLYNWSDAFNGYLRY